MKPHLFFVLSLFACLAGWSVFAQSVDEITALVQNKVDEKVILATIRNSPAEFNLSAADIIRLRDAHVPDSIIVALISHRPAGGTAGAQPKATPPAARPPVPPPAKDSERDGVLSFENLDGKTWAYMYEPEAQTIWISKPRRDGQGNLAPNGGLDLRMPPGHYQLRYNGQKQGQAITIRSGEKTLVMLTRVETSEREALYVNIFQNGDRQAGGLLAVLRESGASAAPAERIIERERIVQVPAATVIYERPVYYYPPAYYYPARPSYFGFGYYHRPTRRSNFSLGVGIGF